MKILKLTFVLFVTMATAGRACDLCGCYVPPHEIGSVTSGPFVSVAEQFTRFGTLQDDGHEINDPAGQWLESSITQIVAGWNFGERFSLQVNVPFIYRSYKRPDDGGLEYGKVSGVGDVSLLGRLLIFNKVSAASGRRAVVKSDGKSTPMESWSEPDFTFTCNVIAGMKFPTGATSRLEEERVEGHTHAGSDEHGNAAPSGIHGHDLSPGTGSFDGVFGAALALRYKRAFIEADIRHTVRGYGAHQYRYANDLTFDVAPGFNFVRHESARVSMQCVLSGEYKDTDTFRGNTVDDTGITALYVGPRVSGAIAERVSGEVELGIPVLLENTGVQIVPDWRLRAGVTVRF